MKSSTGCHSELKSVMSSLYQIPPVIEPAQALKVIKELHPIVDHFKVGKINHNREVENRHDWWEFRHEVERLLQDVEADYYLKKSLTDL
jgi:hypothetical protein